MIKTFIFCLVAALFFIGVTVADTDVEQEYTKPISVIMGTKMGEGSGYRVPKARNFCHAGYGVCPDSHCCPMGGECCETPGTCCPRDYYCMKGGGSYFRQEGCCPNGQVCKF